jgi:hypothetical protein
VRRIHTGASSRKASPAVGYRMAQADKHPKWKPGVEFKAKREEMLRK